MRAGDICHVNLDPTLGDEIRKTRPVVVLNPGLENKLSLAIVVPITGWKAAFKRNPFFLELDPKPRLGLRKKSAVDCFQIRALSHQRFAITMGALNEEELDRVKSSVALILDIYPEHCTI